MQCSVYNLPTFRPDALYSHLRASSWNVHQALSCAQRIFIVSIQLLQLRRMSLQRWFDFIISFLTQECLAVAEKCWAWHSMTVTYGNLLPLLQEELLGQPGEREGDPATRIQRERRYGGPNEGQRLAWEAEDHPLWERRSEVSFRTVLCYHGAITCIFITA